MSFYIQIKIEVVNEQGEPINIHGNDLAIINRYRNLDKPLVSCDRSTSGFASPEHALAAMNKAHSVIKPLIHLIA